ncbi:MAG: 5'-3' exonuclease [Ruminococcaceae bacterium]|nr:5'-3' exonuclease [Oscillospiraceae bacterium]
MDKLMIVDGSNLLFQMFYGMPARIVNARGRAIQGTLGFVGALLKMVRMVQPTHMAVLFDGEYVSSRTELNPDYKGNRVDYTQMAEEDTPFSQLPDIYAALDCLGICHRETSVCEADDWIAGYARQYGREMEVVIVSQDSDFFQLITERVSILRYRGEKTVICTPDYLRQKLAVAPEQYAAFKSLTGDTADHIRGVDGIGPKTAAALMEQFGDLDMLLSNAEQIRRPSVRKAVREHAERIRRNYLLICLEGEGILPFALEELCWKYSGMTTIEVLKKIGVR